MFDRNAFYRAIQAIITQSIIKHGLIIIINKQPGHQKKSKQFCSKFGTIGMSKAINRKTIKLNLSEEDRSYMAKIRDDNGLGSFAEVQKHLLDNHRREHGE